MIRVTSILFSGFWPSVYPAWNYTVARYGAFVLRIDYRCPRVTVEPGPHDNDSGVAG